MSYESDILRDWYLLFHYGAAEEILEGVAIDDAALPARCLDFPVATVEAAGINSEIGRALDLGCAVGRSSFELSKVAREVLGIDFSLSFVQVAEAVGREENPGYRRYREMHLSDELTAKLPEGSIPERVSFEQGDAMDLRTDLGSFDLVHAANLLCRLPEPTRFLERLPDLVNPGGTLVVATPATWMEAYTPPVNFPPALTLDFLKGHLGASFEIQEVNEFPFLIREHQRKLQLSTAQTSVWRRR
ncbi:MAG: putative 4-mercaptohistidine N1-methyltransferase [Verrucomicrobiales bacterium]|nr:putative 4-mercaptohistidine N1-methyltransferase [Verrucomicrobiales bacterium]